MGESADVGASQPEATGDRRQGRQEGGDSPKQWLWAQGREPRPDRDAASARIGGAFSGVMGVWMSAALPSPRG